MPQTPAERQAAYRERQQEKAKAEAGHHASEQDSPVVSESDTEDIVRALRDRAKSGDHLAARELREWIEIKKQTEGKAKDQRLLALLSPELRDAIAEELYGEPLPPSWPHERLTVKP